MDEEFLTIAEFADLPTSAQIVVWEASARGAVESIPASPKSPACAHRYRRGQVEAARQSGWSR